MRFTLLVASGSLVLSMALAMPIAHEKRIDDTPAFNPIAVACEHGAPGCVGSGTTDLLTVPEKRIDNTPAFNPIEVACEHGAPGCGTSEFPVDKREDIYSVIERALQSIARRQLENPQGKLQGLNVAQIEGLVQPEKRVSSLSQVEPLHDVACARELGGCQAVNGVF
ncbi:hypothetical protein PLICRDRAFT_46033 [Plicaturopsis crispa FD-325 SS-3]|uniref:Uncharacterized protein n=1 Tax=Plicaturopsis crispa FD-325 SS-3 TaxID=944288 RepID=A0A0C9T5P8_PLICR|nr:hypothetical protein PLICRDRAFT_46033 [Plicaturopsis crispa FD-325 SS-3]